MVKNYSVFGRTTMQRVYCKSCKCYSLVVDGMKLCCDTPENQVEDEYAFRIVVEPKDIRKIPSKKEQKEILKSQNNTCLYCGKRFYTPYYYKHRVQFTTLAWDHYVPHCFSRDNRLCNFVAACNICNSIKSGKVFENLYDAEAFINYRRKQKGYEYYEDERNNNQNMSELPKEVREPEKKSDILLNKVQVSKLGQNASPVKRWKVQRAINKIRSRERGYVRYLVQKYGKTQKIKDFIEVLKSMA